MPLIWFLEELKILVMILIEMLPNQSGRAVALQDNLISTNLQLESKSQPPECLLALSALRWNICVAILAS